MIGLTNETKNDLINDLVKNSSVLLVQHLLLKYRSKQALFDDDSVYGILFFLAGLTVYWSVVVNVIPKN